MPRLSPRPRIALVVPDIGCSGGIATTAWFLNNVIKASGLFDVEIVSLASGRNDATSTHLLSPRTWVRGPKVDNVSDARAHVRHVGCQLAELEFQRYMPRRILNDLLAGYDLVQVVAGAPAWALPTLRCQRPVLLLVATTVKAERQSLLRSNHGAQGIWRGLMTVLTVRLERSALRGVDAVFVMNSWMAEYCRPFAAGRRVTLAPPGVDTEFFTPLQYQPDGYLLSVGRLSDPRKNVRLLFSAYAQACKLSAEMPDLHLAGLSRPPAESVRLLETMGIAHRVKDHGAVSLSQLRDLYRGASLFVSSADEEGLGIVLLEAGACGLPVLSTATEGAKMVVQQDITGQLTPCGDTTAMARAAAELIDRSADRLRMGQDGRRHIASNFSQSLTGDRFLAKYCEILRGRERA